MALVLVCPCFWSLVSCSAVLEGCLSVCPPRFPQLSFAHQRASQTLFGIEEAGPGTMNAARSSLSVVCQLRLACPTSLSPTSP